MDQTLKQRLVGVVVLTILAAIFVPMLFDEPDVETDAVGSLEVPDFSSDFQSNVVPIPVPPEEGMPLTEPVPETELVLEPQPPGVKGSDTLPKKERPAPSSAAGDQPRQLLSETAALVNSEGTAKPATAPQPVVKSNQPQAASDGWFVQVGSFGREENATLLRDKLRGKGYAAFLESAESEVQGKVYRVKVGPERDKSRAKQVRDKIRVEVGTNGIIIGAD